MKRLCILLATGVLLLGGSAVRAAEPGGEPGTLQLTPVPVAPAPSCCAAPACPGHCGGHWGRFCDWLHYKPPSAHCACCCPISMCYPHNYVWFLDMCQGGCGGGHCCAPVAPPESGQPH